MHSEERLTPAQQELEAALRQLQPAQPSLDRDQLMYRMGRAAGQRQVRRWQGATTLASIVLAALILVPPHHTVPQPSPIPQFAAGTEQVEPEPALETVDDAVLLPAPALPPVTDRLVSATRPRFVAYSYMALRQRVLIEGIDALPDPVASGPPLPQPTLRELLDLPPRKTRLPMWSPLHWLLQRENRS